MNDIIQQKTPANLYEYIDLTRDRPGMYFGENSISALYFHVNGYFTACHFKGIDEDLSPDFDSFHDFVAQYYGYSESTAGWKNIILWENAENESQALNAFYFLFNLFRNG